MRRSQLALGLLLMLGLILRVAVGWTHSDDLLSDNDGYLAHAKPVAAGSGFHGPYSNHPTAFRPPGYPVMLGVLMAAGVAESAAVAAVSLASYLLIVLMTRALALQMGLDQRWALLAVVGVAFDPLLLRYSILPMTEVPCAAILLWAVVAFARFFRKHAAEDRGSMSTGIFAGILFGIGALVRPVVLVVCALLTVFVVFRTLKARLLMSSAPSIFASTGVVRSLLYAIVPAAVAGLVLCPWVIRNAVQFQHFIPATTHGGYTLALGNNSDFYRDVINGSDEFPWDGIALDAWQKKMIQDCERQGVSVSSEPAVDAWYYAQAKAAIRSEPMSFLKATVLRLRRFWAISMADSGNVSKFSRRLVMVWYIIVWIGLFLQMLKGCFDNSSPRRDPMIMLWLVILAFLVMHSVYWTDTRMRAPVMPIMLVISVSGWQSAWTFFFRRTCVS